MKKYLPISIVIPTMNRYEILIETLESIVSGSCIPNEIIIIDQSENKQYLISNISKFKHLDININIIEQIEPSLTKARNLGMKYVNNDIVICCDDDILMENNMLEKIYLKMKNKSIGLIAVLDKNTTESESDNLLGYVFGKKKLNKSNGYVTKSLFGRYPKIISQQINTEYAMGYCFVIRKSILEEGNIMWDENLISYAYPEDLDFSFTYYKYCKLINRQCIINPDIYVTHLASPVGRITSFKKTIMYVIYREYLRYKHFNTLSSRILSYWCNLGEFIRRMIIKDNCLDLLKAQILCEKYRNELKNGNIPIEIQNIIR